MKSPNSALQTYSIAEKNQKDKNRTGKSLKASLYSDLRSNRLWLCNIFPAATLLFLVLFVGSTFVVPHFKEGWWIVDSLQNSNTSSNTSNCKNQYRPPGSDALPRGIVSGTSNLEMRPLWGFPKTNENSSVSLFSMAVGIKQRDLVNKMVTKFLSANFTVMLFHYDGAVDEWNEFEWNNRVLHVSAYSQTKWWFAKRFLHPDVVAAYSYIFLWDEDLGVQHFDPQKYISIIQSEGLEISQPALDVGNSEVHQQITARMRKAKLHRRTFKPSLCDKESKAPPCTGWVEMMAPVFSRAAWRCVWYMIQNDLIHAWGLDYQMGYCAQGDRIENVGVVDAEYIVHYGRPTLGGAPVDKTTSVLGLTPETVNLTTMVASVIYMTSDALPNPHKPDPRLEVRKQSYMELKMFQQRWAKAVEEDTCWIDPYN